MRFWDTSAIVPLLVEQAHSKGCRQLLRADRQVLVWVFARTETTSALWRVHREGLFDRDGLRDAERRLSALARRWHEVDAVLPVREQAERLLRIHPLRTADALQLGAALLAADHRPRGRAFVCLDDRLGSAAESEGFDVLRPGAS
jgi:predicted nucleic acid-binding protein